MPFLFRKPLDNHNVHSANNWHGNRAIVTLIAKKEVEHLYANTTTMIEYKYIIHDYL